MQQIIFISKEPISNFPRLMSIPYALIELGYTVTIFAPGTLPEIFNDRDKIQFKKLNFKIRYGNFLAKITTWIQYRFEVFKKLTLYSNGKLIWLSSADSAIPLIGKIYAFNYILQINELYDENYIYRKLLKKLSKHSKSIIVPEFNRANIFRVWFKIKRLPFILPNKSIIPDSDFIKNNYISQIITEITLLKSEGYKIIIYQGHIGKDRNFTNLVEILHELPYKTHLLLLGKDHGMVDKYKSIYNNTSWVPYIIAPAHLAITKLADIGIIFYNPESLNNIFCAPNKTWEFAKYGLPIISNDIPGMFETTKYYKAGISCSFNSKVELKKSIIKIFNNYSKFSANSRKMYDEFDYYTIINDIIKFSSI